MIALSECLQIILRRYIFDDKLFCFQCNIFLVLFFDINAIKYIHNFEGIINPR